MSEGTSRSWTRTLWAVQWIEGGNRARHTEFDSPVSDNEADARAFLSMLVNHGNDTGVLVAAEVNWSVVDTERFL